MYQFIYLYFDIKKIIPSYSILFLLFQNFLHKKKTAHAFSHQRLKQLNINSNHII